MSLYEQEGFEPKPNSSLVPNPSLVPDMNSLTPVSNNTHRQLYRSRLGAVAPHISDSQAQPRDMGICYMGCTVLFPDVRELHYWHDNVNIVAPVWCDIGESVYRHSELY